MYRKMICLAALVCVFGLTSNVSADLILHWRFDDASGTTAADTSGNGYNGTILGDPQWVVGKAGAALDFSNGLSAESVDVPSAMNGLTAMSVMLWVKSNVTNTDHGFVNFIDPDGGDFGGMRYDAASWAFPGGTNVITVVTPTSGPRARLESASDMQVTEWQHVAMTWASGEGIKLYVNGEQDTAPTGVDPPGEGAVEGIVKLLIGRGAKDDAAGASWDGLIDDVRVYSTAMTAEEIRSAMVSEPFPYAIGPDPANGTLYTDTWITLSWSPGDFAASHDVYIGDNLDDVNSGAEGTFVGNQTDTFIVVGFPGFPFPGGLDPGTTYYWRVDEVNEAEPDSPWKGYIWSFGIPPNTAYSPDPPDGAAGVSVDAQLSWTPGLGSKLHTVYFGETFEEVDTATGGQSQGSSTFAPGTLKMAGTYYWRVDEFDFVETYKGDIWSFTTEGAVANPNPPDGAVDISQTPTLTWQPGVFADTYEVYFGADEASLELKASGNLGEESYEPGRLEWNTTYYWRVDEANDANPDSPWTGPLWSFTTANFLIIDDMENYNDLDPADPNSNRIFLAWVDGFDDPTNGSLIGYDNPPFAEQTIVHSGNQSMPFAYDNAAGLSEATLTLTANRDWTVNGVDRLTIWYRGSSDNAAENLYVVLNDSAVVANDNPDAALATAWTAWDIDLTRFSDQGVNLTNVNSITLGLGNRNNPAAGGAGIMYFDDIRLYALEQ
jgi:hypothetical protein